MPATDKPNTPPQLLIRASDLAGDCFRLNRRFQVDENQLADLGQRVTVLEAVIDGGSF